MHTAASIKANQAVLPGPFASMQHLAHGWWLVSGQPTAQTPHTQSQAKSSPITTASRVRTSATGNLLPGMSHMV